MAEAASRCVLDGEMRTALLSIIKALREETDVVELDGDELDLAALQERVESCDAAGKRGTRKRGPRAPSRYNLFISECRRSTTKGGRGLSFERCVAEWKEQKKAA